LCSILAKSRSKALELPARGTTLSMFAPDPAAELERAKKVAAMIPLFAWFARMGGKRREWVACWRDDGKTHRKYVGSDEALARVRAAHDLVRAEMVRQGFTPPKAVRRARLKSPRAAPRAVPQKPASARGGARLPHTSLRHSDSASNRSERGRSPVAALGSRRRP